MNPCRRSCGTSPRWDEPKRAWTLAERGLDFADLDEAFFLDAVVFPARNGRLKAVGRLGDAVLAVIFVPLGTQGLSVISMRVADRKERALL